MASRLAVTRPCRGEVHSTGADGCMVCLGHRWGVTFRCPDCIQPLVTSATRRTGLCPQGHGRFDIPKEKK